MSHGQAPGDPATVIPQEVYDADPEMWSGLYGSMAEFLALEAALEGDGDEH